MFVNVFKFIRKTIQFFSAVFNLHLFYLKLNFVCNIHGKKFARELKPFLARLSIPFSKYLRCINDAKKFLCSIFVVVFFMVPCKTG